MTPVAQSHILVAGIGNIFFGDDGFGSELVRGLDPAQLPPDVKIVDYGIRSLDLAYALLEPYSCVILVDAIARGGTPGTVYLLQPAETTARVAVSPDPHSMEPVQVLAMARSIGDITAQIFIIGCEPEDLGDELTGRMDLSATVSAAIPEAVHTIHDLLAQLGAWEESLSRTPQHLPANTKGGNS